VESPWLGTRWHAGALPSCACVQSADDGRARTHTCRTVVRMSSSVLREALRGHIVAAHSSIVHNVRTRAVRASGEHKQWRAPKCQRGLRPRASKELDENNVTGYNRLTFLTRERRREHAVLKISLGQHITGTLQ